MVGRVFLHPFRPLGNEWLEGFGLGVAGSWGRVDGQAPASYKTIAASGNFFTIPRIPAVATEGERVRWSPQAYWYAGPVGFLAEYVVSQQLMHRDFTADPGSSLKSELRNSAWQVAAASRSRARTPPTRV